MMEEQERGDDKKKAQKFRIEKRKRKKIRGERRIVPIVRTDFIISSRDLASSGSTAVRAWFTPKASRMCCLVST